MLKQESSSLYIKLALFLLTTAFLSVATLYFEVNKENRELKKQVETLKASQVLLMVPDEQADALSEWLNSHPESIETLLKQKKDDKPELPQNVEPKNMKSVDIKNSQAQLSFGSEEIKTYKLPHGGIRVTTRKE